MSRGYNKHIEFAWFTNKILLDSKFMVSAIFPDVAYTKIKCKYEEHSKETC